MFIILNEGFGGLGGFCEWRKDIKLYKCYGNLMSL